jgi:hypothetical protein
LVILFGSVGPTVFPEGCRFVQDGILDCSQSQGTISWSQKLPLSESHDKGSDDPVSLRSCEGVKEDVIADADGSKVFGEPVPQLSVVLVCASCNCSFAGSFSRNAQCSQPRVDFVGQWCDLKMQ